ncbi:MAG: hypothetical protein KatS3mg103_1318 [Phycisphaerales bacterium]|nr:MAG: hypothetical protein KatS3mg103_1318 [Phycisphaerales bacterium]
MAAGQRARAVLGAKPAGHRADGGFAMHAPNDHPPTEHPGQPMLRLAPADEGPGLRLAEDASHEAVAQVGKALDHAQRRLDNLRALIDRFHLDDDDGPRAA